MNSIRTLRVGLLCILGLRMLSGCDRFESPAQRIERAQRQLDVGDYGLAAVELRNVVAKDAANPAAQLQIARLNLQTGTLDGVPGALDIARADPSQRAAANVLQARLLLQQGKFDALLAAIDGEQLALTPEQKQLFHARALIGLNRGTDALVSLTSLEVSTDEATRTAASVALAQLSVAAGQPARALKVLDAALARDPASAELWLTRGLVQRARRQWVEAEESFRNALPLARGTLLLSQHVGLINDLADAQLARGDVEGARQMHADLVKIASQSTVTELLEARIQLASGDAPTAVASLQRLVGKQPGLMAARGALLAALLEQNSLSQANQHVDELAQGNPQNDLIATARQRIRAATKAERDSDAYSLAVGAAQVVLGQPGVGRETLARAAKAHPDSIPVAMARAQLEMQLRRPAEALTIATAAREHHPADDGTAKMLAELLLSQRQFGQAEALYAEMWMKNPSAATAVALYRARRLGALPMPIASLQEWLSRNPQDAGVRTMLAEYLQSSGQAMPAIEELQRVLRRAPRNPVALNNLSLLYQQIGDARALPTARAAFEIAPQSPLIADTYGWLLFQSGKTQEALSILKSASDALPTHPDLRYHYAAVSARAGDAPRARTLLDQALDGDTPFESRAAAQQLKSTLGPSL